MGSPLLLVLLRKKMADLFSMRLDKYEAAPDICALGLPLLGL